MTIKLQPNRFVIVKIFINDTPLLIKILNVSENVPELIYNQIILNREYIKLSKYSLEILDIGNYTKKSKRYNELPLLLIDNETKGNLRKYVTYFLRNRMVENEIPF